MTTILLQIENGNVNFIASNNDEIQIKILNKDKVYTGSEDTPHDNWQPDTIMSESEMEDYINKVSIEYAVEKIWESESENLVKLGLATKKHQYTTLEEKNTLVAEFMGAQVSKYYPYLFHYAPDIIPDKSKNHSFQWTPVAMQYDRSWDWLLPVLLKIYSTEYKCLEMDLLEKVRLISKIESVYQMAVDFIVRYNRRDYVDFQIKQIK